MTSGYISIPESVEKIDEDNYDHTVEIMEEMAERNGLSGLYKIPYWPVDLFGKSAKADISIKKLSVTRLINGA